MANLQPAVIQPRSRSAPARSQALQPQRHGESSQYDVTHQVGGYTRQRLCGMTAEEWLVAFHAAAVICADEDADELEHLVCPQCDQKFQEYTYKEFPGRRFKFRGELCSAVLMQAESQAEAEDRLAGRRRSRSCAGSSSERSRSRSAHRPAGASGAVCPAALS